MLSIDDSNKKTKSSLKRGDKEVHKHQEELKAGQVKPETNTQGSSKMGRSSDEEICSTIKRAEGKGISSRNNRKRLGS